MVSAPDLHGYDSRRRSPGWLAALLPVSLALALLRLLARALARAILVLPRTVFDAERFGRTLVWTAGGWLLVRLTLFHHAVFFERDYAFFWLWREAELLFVFPRWLNRLWTPWFGAYHPDRFLSVVKPWLLLIGVWALGLHLALALLRAIRIGLGPDGETPLPWPRPQLQAPLPVGFLLNWLAFGRRLAPLFGLLIVVPPRTRPYWPWAPLNDPITLALPLWTGLRWLVLPRRLDGQVQTLLRRDPAWTTNQPLASSPQHHLSRATLELLGIELGLIAFALAAGCALLWLLTAWSRAADDSSEDAPWTSGPRRRSPGWAIGLLPLTLPAALVLRSAWRSPRWLPGLIVKLLLLYAVSVVALFLVVWIGVGRHDGSNWAAMQFLRHWWDWLEVHLRYPARWHRSFHAIPHGRTERISDSDILHAMWLLSVVDAAALASLLAMLGLAVSVGKRALEAVAR